MTGYLLHGMPGWGYAWSAVLPALAGKARVLIPDLLGFGYSDKRDCFDRSIAAQSAILEDWMKNLGLGRVTVAGHDIGGGVALRLATLYPARVERLCLIASVCYDSWPSAALHSLGHPQVDQRLSSRRVASLLKRKLKQVMFTPSSDEFIAGLIQPYATEVGKLSLIRNAVALNTNLTLEISHLLPQLQLPTLILWGQDDNNQPIHYAERLAGDIPGARWALIQGTRHFPMLEKPAIVADFLAKFVASADTSPSRWAMKMVVGDGAETPVSRKTHLLTRR